MPKDNFLDRLQRLPLGLKFTGFGAFLTLVSVVLPWYEDLDAFNTGDRFIGLSGPLYLLGFLILAMAVSSFALTGFRFIEKKLPKLPLEESHFHIFVGAMSLFLLIITSSIYFHPKFGVNITMKEMQIGMITAFIGTIFVLLGGLRMNKEKGISFETEGKLDRLIDVEDKDRLQQDIKGRANEVVKVEEIGEANVETEPVEVKQELDL